jgi:hypothetical protein
MKNIRLCILALTLTTANIVAMESTPTRGRLSTCYHNTANKLSNHKGKVGLAVGAIGTGFVLRVFNKEINDYVKPLIKSVWKRTTEWLRRIFRRDKKA